MARIRSPNYPQLGLREALERVRKIHDKEFHLAAPRDVIAKHLGYGGMNGASAKTISAIAKYDLLEEAGGDKMKVSPLAVSILFPKDAREKGEAIRRAALAPALFSDIDSEWGGHKPSDDSLRSFLIRRNFARDAVERVIESYGETVAFVEQEAGAYDSSSPKRDSQEPEATMQEPQATAIVTASPVGLPVQGVDPWRVSLTSGAVEGAFRLDNPDQADELIAALTAFKGFLKKPS
jgi:hypothetical protein